MEGIAAQNPSEKKLYDTAFWLAIFTIFYNIAEGVVATVFGYEDETLALFGFGLDSFIETVSGLGIAVMITRIRKNPGSLRSDFEKTALHITGISFYVLAAGLTLSAIVNTYLRDKPVTTFWGVVISLISIVIMLVLIYGKIRTGRLLRSDAILADANCTKVCIYMSCVLLVSSAIYEFTGFAYADSIGTLGLAWFSFKEGQECFEKIRSGLDCCDHDH